jgi:hypothetical protein
MDRRILGNGRNEGMRGIACHRSSEVRVMAAVGLWQDLREGLDQAAHLCRGLLRKEVDASWCKGAYGGDQKEQIPGIELLIWRTASPCKEVNDNEGVSLQRHRRGLQNGAEG